MMGLPAYLAGWCRVDVRVWVSSMMRSSMKSCEVVPMSIVMLVGLRWGRSVPQGGCRVKGGGGDSWGLKVVRYGSIWASFILERTSTFGDKRFSGKCSRCREKISHDCDDW